MAESLGSVLSVAHYYPPHIGGVEVVAQKQAESIAKMGYRSSVATAAPSKQLQGYAQEGTVQVHRLQASDLCDKRFGFPFPLLGLKSLAAMRRLVKAASLVHIHDVFYQTSWVAYLWAKIYKKPIVLTQHVAFVAHPSPLVMGAQRLVYGTIGRLIFKAAKRIVVYNHNVKTFLLGRGVSAAKVLETRNGIEIEHFNPVDRAGKRELREKYGLPLDRPIVLFVGRLVHKKGFDILYEARDPTYELVFVGNGKVPEGWKAAGHVHFLGPRKYEELIELYALSDLFILPAEGEMLTLVMQEAMASGLPIVTTDDPAYERYDLDPTRIAFVSRRPEIIKAKLLELVHSPGKLQEMSFYSREIAEKMFDWNRNVKEIEAIYRTLLTKPTIDVTTSWDDGHTLDLKLADLLEKYHVKGTFYVAPKNREFAPGDLLTTERIAELSGRFEIGAHTVTHPRLPLVPLAEARQEIIDSKTLIEGIIGKPVTSFCYPRGEYTKDHVAFVREAGYSYARTVDRFYFGKDLPEPLEARTSVNTYNHKMDLLKIAVFARWNPVKFVQYLQWDRLAIDMYKRLERSGGVFHLWGHSWELEDHHDWERLENVLAFLAAQPNARFITNGELVDGEAQ